MNSTSLTFRDASLEVLKVVLTECSKQREHAGIHLGIGEPWAPVVHCSGNKDGEMIYNIVTPWFAATAALAIMSVADRASSATTL